MEQYEDLSLTRQDIHQVGPLSKKTLRVLSIGENKVQKVAVGDDLGVLQVFTVRKGEVIVSVSHL